MIPSQDCKGDVLHVPLAADTLLQNRYRIVRHLGRGGMGAVYEALDQRLGITVALKETLSSEESTRRQFEREARLLARVQHPALPRVSDHFVEGDRAFLVMQFIGGIDLAKIIARQPGPFPRDQVIGWAYQLLDALIYLHSQKTQVIHRDIKPHNLKLTASGQIALLDFGLAKAQSLDQSATASHAFFGYTRHYAPLEQIQDQRTDPRTDIYGLGATLYHLLTGIKPPDAMVRAAAVVAGGADPLQSADRIHLGVGSELAAILNKAMAQKPEERYASANEFREALRRICVAQIREMKVERKPANKLPQASVGGILHLTAITSSPVPKGLVVNLALVESARRFGPAGATAVFVLVVVLAGGVLYASSYNEIPSTSTGYAAAALVQSPGARKSGRLRALNGVAGSFAKSADLSGRKYKQRVATRNSASSIPVSQGEKSRAYRNHRRLGAPSIRLPTPEIRGDSPPPPADARISSLNATPNAPRHSSFLAKLLRRAKVF